MVTILLTNKAPTKVQVGYMGGGGGGVSRVNQTCLIRCEYITSAFIVL